MSIHEFEATTGEDSFGVHPLPLISIGKPLVTDSRGVLKSVRPLESAADSSVHVTSTTIGDRYAVDARN